ncbi:MAG: YtxH domain-containing protein [Eubacteriales bacterium]
MSIKDLLEMAGKDKKKKQKAQNAKKLAAGIGIAATVGVAAGVLLAPKAGKETRKDIIDKAEDVVESTKEIAHKKAEIVKKSASHAAHEIKGVLKDAHIKKDAVKKDIKDGGHEVAHDIDTTADKIAEDLKNSDK